MAKSLQDLQKSLKALRLQPCSETEGFKRECLLMGKILSTRSFKRYTLNEIIAKAWGPRAKVQIKSLRQNTFKFLFTTKDERDKVFWGRPWSINGFHMILEEWLDVVAIHKVPFDFFAFTVQIHSLPHMYLHAGLAKLLGSKVGRIHEESISMKYVVAQRYLGSKLTYRWGTLYRLGISLEAKQMMKVGFSSNMKDLGTSVTNVGCSTTSPDGAHMQIQQQSQWRMESQLKCMDRG